MRGGNEGEALYRRPDPVARGGGATGPPCRPQEGRPAPLAGPLACRPLGGRQTPLFFFSRDFVANLKKKKLHLSPVAPIGRPGYIFEIFPKPTYIFEILIFLNIKKKKPPDSISQPNLARSSRSKSPCTRRRRFWVGLPWPILAFAFRGRRPTAPVEETLAASARRLHNSSIYKSTSRGSTRLPPALNPSRRRWHGACLLFRRFDLIFESARCSRLSVRSLFASEIFLSCCDGFVEWADDDLDPKGS